MSVPKDHPVYLRYDKISTKTDKFYACQTVSPCLYEDNQLCNVVAGPFETIDDKYFQIPNNGYKY